jgi:hypothetical protein
MSGKVAHSHKVRHKMHSAHRQNGLLTMGNLLGALEEAEPEPATSAYNFSNMFGALEDVEHAMKEKAEKRLEAALKKAEKERKALEKAGLEAAAKAPVLVVSSRGRSIKKPQSYKETGIKRKGGKRTRRTHKKNKRSSK